jgi:hypothetical protein
MLCNNFFKLSKTIIDFVFLIELNLENLNERRNMDFEMTFKEYLETNRDNLKMGVAHGNFDDAIRIVFSAGFDKGMEHAVQFVENIKSEEL